MKTKIGRKTILKSIGLVASASHTAMCPLHGVVWKIGGIGAMSSAYSESSVGKMSEEIHHWQEEKLADLISIFYTNPNIFQISQPHIENIHNYNHNHKQTELQTIPHTEYKPEIYNQAHIGVDLLNYGLVAAFTIPLAINGIKKIASKYQKTNLEVKL
jgi:hypothetical protein